MGTLFLLRAISIVDVGFPAGVTGYEYSMLLLLDLLVLCSWFGVYRLIIDEPAGTAPAGKRNLRSFFGGSTFGTFNYGVGSSQRRGSGKLSF